MHRICVFCGSNSGTNGLYGQAAVELGRLMADRGLGLVYGGGSVGLMGTISDAILANGGEVIGVIPEALATKELAHSGVSEMHVVPSMHVRKARMAEFADAFIAMPGGFGTLEELFETITWAKLGIHNKPIGLLNVAGYFDPLLTFIDQAVRHEFVRPEHRELIVTSGEPTLLLDSLADHQMPGVRKWITSVDT